MRNKNEIIILSEDDMQIIQGLVDRVTEKNGVSFVSSGDKCLFGLVFSLSVFHVVLFVSKSARRSFQEQSTHTRILGSYINDR